MTVVPATVVVRKHFSGAAVALALTLWGLCGWSPAARVRAAVAAWVHTVPAQGGWSTYATCGTGAPSLGRNPPYNLMGSSVS
jgi:hypothetical protein